MGLVEIKLFQLQPPITRLLRSGESKCLERVINLGRSKDMGTEIITYWLDQPLSGSLPILTDQIVEDRQNSHLRRVPVQAVR